MNQDLRVWSRCVIWRSLVLWGREVSTFFATSDKPISAAFKDTISIKLSKAHLRDQKNRLARTIWAHARLRARKSRLHPTIFEKTRKYTFMGHIFWRAACVQPRAHVFHVRQSILLIIEMIFDYMIANVAQKAEKIEVLEICKKFKIWNFSKFQIFNILFVIFMSFNFMSFHRLYSYRSDQILKNYLRDQENRLACITWAYARLRARKPRPRSLLCWKLQKTAFSQLSLLALSARATAHARM